MSATVSANEPAQPHAANLEITPSHVQLGDQTWAMGQIKDIGITRAGSGLGILVGVWFGLIVAGFLWGALLVPDWGLAFWLIVTLGVTGILTYASWIKYDSSKVWLRTGLVPADIFISRDKAEAEAIKRKLETMISQHTPQR